MSELNVYKFKLSSGKTIYLKEPTMSDTEFSLQIAGNGVKDNVALIGFKTQKEMLKRLLVQVDDKKLSLQEKENLDSLFNTREIAQCFKAISKISGEDEGNFDMTPELTSSGDR